LTQWKLMQEASKNKIDIIERAAELKKELAANAEVREAAPKATRKGAFEKYLRNGMGALSASERSLMGELRGTSTQVVGTDSLGGFLVPQEFSNELDMASLFTGEVERLAKEIEHCGWRIVGLPNNQRHCN
jgi:HK97 family phage major capsid protein